MEKIRKIIIAWLEEQHGIGTKSGGSGHLGTKSLDVHDFSISKEDNGFVADVVYEVSTITEFTYYPDNPPRYTRYRQVIHVGPLGTIQKYEKAEIISTNNDDELLDNWEK